MRFKIAEFCELAHIAFGCSSREAKFGNNFISSNFLFVGHKNKNIDQFLSQR